MNKIIKTDNFTTLVESKKEILSDDTSYSKIVDKMKNEFTEEQKIFFVTNLCMYLEYHPTKDFPVDLQIAWKLLEFANFGNAKISLVNNFIEGIDYQIALLATQKRKNEGGFNKETIMMNVETFKTFCMMVKTDKGKEIRKYYIKLETIYNDLIKEEIEEKNRLFKQLQLESEEKTKMLEETKIENEKLQSENEEKKQLLIALNNKPELYGFYSRKGGYVYIFKDVSRPGHIKIGFSSKLFQRIASMNSASSCSSIEIYTYYYVFDMKFAEDIIHNALLPLKIKTESNKNEWFYVQNDNELLYVVNTMEECINFIKVYDINKLEYDGDMNKLQEIEDQSVKEKLLRKEKKIEILTKNAQCQDARTGKYKGVCFDKNKKKWDSSITKDGKHFFLGYYETDLEAAIIYNDYAIYLNETQNQNYTINQISTYTPNPRDIIYENRKKDFENKTSNYTGVIFYNNRYNVGIVYKTQRYDLGSYATERECAILYNKQAMYYNQTFGTNYILNEIPDYVNVAENVYEKISMERNKKIEKKTSKYIGVRLTPDGKYNARISSKHIGNFDVEIEAAKAYNKKAIELNENKTSRLFKLNIFQ